jgi:hypothetical protein
MVTDPTGTPLNVRRFDGKVIGALHNGEIVKILLWAQTETVSPGLMSLMRQTEKAGYIGSSSAATEADRRWSGAWTEYRRLIMLARAAVGATRAGRWAK